MKVIRPATVLLATLLGACATTTVVNGPERVGLIPRDISPDACALYVWTAGPERIFTYFADQEGASLWENAELELGPVASPLSPSQELSFTYGEDVYSWTLELQGPKAFGGGTRYDSGLLRSSNQGFERVLPVVGLSTCPEG